MRLPVFHAKRAVVDPRADGALDAKLFQVAAIRIGAKLIQVHNLKKYDRVGAVSFF